MSGSRPELGSKISLISKADIRYEGRLYTVDRQECTIALSSVRSFGTEDRETQSQIAPQSQIYDYILFRGIDIKDIRVINNSLPHPNDPAIMQVQLPNGQHVMPHLSMPGMNTQQVPPMGGVINNSLPYPNDPAIMQVQLPNGQHVMPHLSMPGMNTQQVPPMGGVGTYGNPFEPMGGLGATGGGGGGVPQSLEPGSGAPGPFMMGNQQVPPQPKQPQNQQSQTQQQQKQTMLFQSLLPTFNLQNAAAGANVENQQQPQQQQLQVQQQKQQQQQNVIDNVEQAAARVAQEAAAAERVDNHTHHLASTSPQVQV